jgi:hypothetical protein
VARVEFDATDEHLTMSLGKMYWSQLVCVVGIVVAWPCASGQLTVGRSVLVSADKSNVDHYEVTLCADPVRPGRLIAASMAVNDEFGERDGFVYVSTDAGKSWHKTLEQHSAADPACTFGYDGGAYMTFMNARWDGVFGGVQLYRSPDGGVTWDTASPPVGRDYVDRQWVAVGPPGAPNAGELYLNALQYVPYSWSAKKSTHVFLYDLGMRGTSFGFPAISVAATTAYHNGNLVVLSDGTIVMASYDIRVSTDSATGRVRGRLYAMTSTDRGKTLNAPVAVADGIWTWPQSYTNQARIPSVAVDRTNGPFRDRVYVVWTDQREGRAQPFFTFSSDKGRSWAPARPLDVAHPFDPKKPWEGPHSEIPAIAVNKDGAVAALWTDGGERPNSPRWAVMVTSLDGGMTWSAPTRVSDVPLVGTSRRQWFARASRQQPGPLTMYVTWRQPTKLGDTMGLIADPTGTFFPLWLDDRNGFSQLRIAPVAVRGTVTAVRDVTDSVHVEFGQWRADSNSHVVRVPVRIKNVSRGTSMQTPMTIEVIDVPADSMNAGSRVRNADNGRDGRGAVWSFTSSSGSDTIGPGEATTWRELVFGYRSSPHWRDAAVEMRWRVLSSSPAVK